MNQADNIRVSEAEKNIPIDLIIANSLFDSNRQTANTAYNIYTSFLQFFKLINNILSNDYKKCRYFEY